jgi:transglutaminase-like putative cysteine protease
MSTHGHRLTIAAAIATTAASVSLYPLFLGSAWFFAGVGATVTVAAAGTLTRLRRLPLLACLTISLLMLLLYLNLVFEFRPSYGHVLPTLSSLQHLGRLLGTGLTDSARYAPPAPELPGMLLLGAGGIGIVALLVDFTAVRLRNPALAGAPLLLLVTEPFAVSAGRSWFETMLAFCLGTAGFLGLLSADSRERIREWEEPGTGSHGAPDMTTLAIAGRRVGAVSVVIALCLPLFIPGLHVTRLLGGKPGIGGNPGDAAGGAGTGFPSPETAMSSQLLQTASAPVLHYQVSTARPASASDTPGASTSEPEYLQLYVLDQLTDAGFQLVSGRPAVPVPAGSGTLPAAPGLEGDAAAQATSTNWPLVSTTIQVSPGINAETPLNGKTAAVLPVPYPALSVTLPRGTWQARPDDLMVYSTDTQVGGLQYRVLSLDPSPTSLFLADAGRPPASITKDYLSVPSSYKALAALAQTITSGQLTAIDKAQALQQWLGSSGIFTYTLKAPAITSAAGLESFLDSSKRGYCQQFAVAMAVLSRLVGIPSRVVVGYTSGTRQKDGSWLVTTHDAHEWPELYFAGSGWLRFEPTPGGQAGQGTAVAPAYSQLPTASTGSGPASTGQNGSIPSGSVGGPQQPAGGKHLPNGVEGPGGGSGSIAQSRHAGLTTWQVLGLVLAGLLAVAAITPWAARLAIRRRRWGRARRGGDAALANAAWRELQDDLVDYQAGYAPSESPRALGARLGAERQLTTVSMEALNRIALAQERAQYAASPLPGGRLQADSALVRRGLAATATRARRLRARVLPPSVVRYPGE